jgi:hypothetical protein
MFIGVPIGIGLGIGAVIFFYIYQRSPSVVPEAAFTMVNNFVLTAVPMYILMGELLVHTGLSERLYQGATKWLAWAPGSEYEVLEQRGRELTTPGAREVIARAKDSAASKPLHDWLRDILKEAETLPEWAALEAATKEMRAAEKQKKLMGIIHKIDSALDGIALMRAFPGRCHLCPV